MGQGHRDAVPIKDDDGTMQIYLAKSITPKVAMCDSSGVPEMKYRIVSSMRRVHQLGQMVARFLGLDSRGPYARAFLKLAGFPDDYWMERAFPLVGKGNQDALDAQKCGIPLEKQSSLSDCEHLFFRYKLWHHSPLFTFQTNHSRNVRHTTTRNRVRSPRNGSGDFNFAHFFCKYVPAGDQYDYVSSDQLEDSECEDGGGNDEEGEHEDEVDGNHSSDDDEGKSESDNEGGVTGGESAPARRSTRAGLKRPSYKKFFDD